jgi:hypothetical protein
VVTQRVLEEEPELLVEIKTLIKKERLYIALLQKAVLAKGCLSCLQVNKVHLHYAMRVYYGLW